jgi:HEAT repeat protein
MSNDRGHDDRGHDDRGHDDRGHEVEARRFAVLSERPGPEAASRIAVGLADSDWRVRKEAASSAGRLASDPAVIAVLVEAVLQPEDVSSRNAAIEAFAHVGARGARPLIDALARSTVTARKFVCAALGGTGPEGIPVLADLARDPDPNTATVALESLARIGGSAAEDALRGSLRAEDWVVRLAALEGLAQLGSRVPVSTLAPLIEDPLLRRFAIRLLGRSEDLDAVAPLARCLRGPTSGGELAEIAIALSTLADDVPGASSVIGEAARALASDQRVELRTLLPGDDLFAARAAAHLLALARDTDALGAISALAARAEIGAGAVSALRAFGADAVRPLLAVADSLEPSGRAWALEVAAELAAIARTAHGEAASEGTPAALGSEVRARLRAALEAQEEVVVRAATRALSYWAEPGDAEVLVRVGSEHRGAVARAAGTALEALSQTAPRSVESASEIAPVDGAEAWSTAIAALGVEAALEKLRAAISSGEPAARRAALLVLDRIDGEEAAELASVALADEDVEARVAAVTVLSRMRDHAARDVAGRTLRVALREESPAVRAAAARALGALGDVSATDALRDLLRDSGPGVALAALSAMRALGSTDRASEPDLEELLVDVLGHPDAEVVKEGLRVVAGGRLERKEVRLALGLAHPAWDVRRLAASLLGELGSAESRQCLAERKAIETDDLVLGAIDDALAGRSSGGKGA